MHTITRENTGPNIGYRLPIVHWEFIDDWDGLDVKCVPKGSGSENMSFLKMCVPADGVKGVKQFVLESIVGAGGKPCPPGIVGVGIGGSADYAMYLAKEAIMRPIGTRNGDPLVAQLEDELFGAAERDRDRPDGPRRRRDRAAVPHRARGHAHDAQPRRGQLPVLGGAARVSRDIAARRHRSTSIENSEWRTHEVTFPITDPQEILKLRAGDEVTVQGHIIGIRDRTQVRIFDQGVEPPMDLRGAFLLHTAPGVRKLDERQVREGLHRHDDERAHGALHRAARPQYGVRAICGKGGFPDEAIEPMHRLGMVYFAIVGGAAALETTQIEEIEEVAWEELMPECLWKFRVKDFGPLTVGIDAHGNSLYHDVQERAQEKLKELFARL